jgi:AraC family transcriptional regulator
MVVDRQDLQTEQEWFIHVRQYIRNHMGEQLDREKLASVTGFSVPHLHRLFTWVCGESPAAYIRRERMIRAGQKLRMGAVDIMEVALAAGYSSHAAFSKAFKQHFGLSPNKFRQLDFQTSTELLRRG